MNSVEQVLFTELPGKMVTASYWFQAPSGVTLPYVVYFQANDPNAKTVLSHYGGQARVQFDVYAANPFEVVDIRREVKDAVRGIRGDFGGVYIVNAEVTNEVTRGLTDDGYHSAVVDAIFHWEDRRQ